MRTHQRYKWKFIVRYYEIPNKNDFELTLSKNFKNIHEFLWKKNF